ncbi:hypothetical protein [Sorangium sp. So ce131]|uniref:hypothetical protein n=1 Tax=Sorangium sp. So ce131 TaxID=3133282 RepID=UPI003F61FD83
MADRVNWPETVFGQTTIFVQSGEDKITAFQEDFGTGNGLRAIGLQSAHHVTWLKRIRLLADDFSELGSISTQDEHHGPVWIEVPPGTSKIEFVKAKAFYIPTGMYIVEEHTPEQFPTPRPYRVLFTWERD